MLVRSIPKFCFCSRRDQSSRPVFLDMKMILKNHGGYPIKCWGRARSRIPRRSIWHPGGGRVGILLQHMPSYIGGDLEYRRYQSGPPES